MKIIIITLASALMLTTSCKKEKLEPVATTPATQVSDVQGITVQDKNIIEGKWKLVRMTGGLRGMDMSAEEQGLDQHYEFMDKNLCNFTENGNMLSTTYKLFKAPSYTKGTDGDFVTVTDHDTYEVYFAHDTLVMSWDVRIDGTLNWYVREQ